MHASLLDVASKQSSLARVSKVLPSFPLVTRAFEIYDVLDRSTGLRTGHWEPTAIPQMINTKTQRLNRPQAGLRPRARGAFVSVRHADRVHRPRARSTACAPLSGSRLGGRTPSGPLFLLLQRRGSRNPTVPPQCSESEGDGAQLRSILWACGTLTRTPLLRFRQKITSRTFVV